MALKEDIDFEETFKVYGWTKEQLEASYDASQELGVRYCTVHGYEYNHLLKDIDALNVPTTLKMHCFATCILTKHQTDALLFESESILKELQR